MNRLATICVSVIVFLSLVVVVIAQTKKSPTEISIVAAATVNGVVIPKSRIDTFIHTVQKDASDSAQLRNDILNRLIEAEILSQEAVKNGLDKTSEFNEQMDTLRVQYLAAIYIQNYLINHPINDSDVKKEYDRLRTSNVNTEYKISRILMKHENDAVNIIAKLNSGVRFHDIDKDIVAPNTIERLDWNMISFFIKPYSDAIQKLGKG
jgi:peptidyl-prolyl cis-trans isomerase C